MAFRFAAVLCVATALLMPLAACAAEEDEALTSREGWQIASDINLTLTQNAYSNNWAGDETGTIAWALTSNTNAEKQFTQTLNSSTTLRLSFGQTHTQNRRTKVWAKPIKSTDIFDLQSVLRLTYGWVVDPFVSGRVQTQFLDQSDTLKTRLFNPATFTESAGVSRMLIDQDPRKWSVRIGAALRQQLDRDALPSDGGSERENLLTNDAGIEFVSSLRIPLADDAIIWSSDLDVFQALYSHESKNVKRTDDWKSPDVNWENNFSAGITEHISVSLYVQLLYDREVDSDIRLQESLGLGVTFRIL